MRVDIGVFVKSTEVSAVPAEAVHATTSFTFQWYSNIVPVTVLPSVSFSRAISEDVSLSMAGHACQDVNVLQTTERASPGLGDNVKRYMNSLVMHEVSLRSTCLHSSMQHFHHQRTVSNHPGSAISTFHTQSGVVLEIFAV